MVDKTVARPSSSLNGLLDLIVMDNIDKEVVKRVSLPSIIDLVKADYANDIGLHLIKNMIEKNGGKIEVNSKLGKGTTFTCYLKEYDLNLQVMDTLKYKN